MEAIHKALLLSLVAMISILIAIVMGVPMPWAIIQPDSASYMSLASNLAEGGQFSMDGVTPSARRELLYPLFLATFIWLDLVEPYLMTVGNVFPVLLAQALMYVLALYMLGRLARKTIGETPAALVILFGTLYLPISQYAFQILSELPTLLLVVTFFSAIQWWQERRGLWRLFLAGVILGAGGLIKAVMIPFGAVAAVFLFCRTRMSLLAAFLFFCASILLPLSWAARNYVQFDQVILATTDGSSSFYRGNMMLGEQPPSMSDPRIPHDIAQAAQADDSILVDRVKERFASHPFEFVAHLAYKAFVLLFGLPSTLIHVAIMLSKMILVACVVFIIPSVLRKKMVTTELIYVFAVFLLTLYTLLFSTPRYFVPAFYMLIPCALDGGRQLMGLLKGSRDARE